MTEQRGSNGPMKITEIKGFELSQDFIDAATTLGYKERDYNDGEQEGIVFVLSLIVLI